MPMTSTAISPLSHPMLNDKKVPMVEVEQFRTDLTEATEAFVSALRSFDGQLYAALAKVYHLYLLATKPVPEFQEMLNSLVATRLDQPKFDIGNEPAGNQFRKLIDATLLYFPETPGSNQPSIEKPEANNTWSMALHYCLRQHWTPDEALEQLAAVGVRKLYDEEMRARANRASAEEVKAEAGRLAKAALDELKTMEGKGTPVSLPKVIDPGSGLGLFMGRITDGGVELLAQAPASAAELTGYAKKWFDAMRLDRAPAGPLVYLLRLGRRFLGDPGKCIGIIRATSTNTTFLLTLQGRTVKATSHIVAVVPVPIDGLGSEADHLLTGDALRAIYNTIADKSLASDWRFEARVDDAAKLDGVDRHHHYLVADTPEGPEQFSLSPGAQAEDKLIALLDAPPTEMVFRVSAVQWSRLLEWRDESEEEAESKEMASRELDWTVKGGKLAISTGKDASDHELSLGEVDVASGNSTSFRLKANMLNRLTDLMALSSSEPSTWAVTGTSLFVTVGTERATYAVHIRLDPTASQEAPAKPSSKAVASSQDKAKSRRGRKVQKSG